MKIASPTSPVCSESAVVGESKSGYGLGPYFSAYAKFAEKD